MAPNRVCRMRDEEVTPAEARALVQKVRALTGQAKKDALAFHFGRR